MIGLFRYYRKYVEHYTSLIEPLILIKTKGFKEAAKEGREQKDHAEVTHIDQICNTNQELQEDKDVFVLIKHKLYTAPILGHPDFDRSFILYIDSSKQRGFGAALHQLDNKDVKRVILYLSKSLITAEKNYESTELETAALI